MKDWNLITPNGQHLYVRHEDFGYWLGKTFGEKSDEANKSFCKSGRYGAWVCSNYGSNFSKKKSKSRSISSRSCYRIHGN